MAVEIFGTHNEERRLGESDTGHIERKKGRVKQQITYLTKGGMDCKKTNIG